MGVLKSSDILAEVKDQNSKAAPTTKPPKNSKHPKRQSKDLDERKRHAAIASEAKPSPYETELRHKLRQKVQLSFGLIPEFINDEFNRLAANADMNKREFFYDLLRQAGAEIPPYEQLDGRKL
tara:strand:+ start:203 stop:571 length:369 start_codon:yes stop_codon:yes gene_type:complete